MNENLNLVEILKDCPKGTKLYSTVFGEVEFEEITKNITHPIAVRTNDGLIDDKIESFSADGKIYSYYDGECVLFPSKDQRDWSKFKPKQPKFDPKTWEAFDRVLTRNNKLEGWAVQLFSHIIEGELHYPYYCINNSYKYCIPYNDDTKHLVGTSDDCPEYYKWWEK